MFHTAPMQAIHNCRADQALHDSAASRFLERLALETLPPFTLMQRAGLAAARLALSLAPHERCFWVFCGPGHNGGDGLESARVLHLTGRKAVAILAGGRPECLPPGAHTAYQRALDAGVEIRFALPAPAMLQGHLVIDALLGLGFQGKERPLPETLTQAFALLQAHRGPVLALDLPSGLNPDTGEGQAWTPRATATLSLLTLKPGLFTGQGRDLSGSVWWDPLGVTGSIAPSAWLSCGALPPARRPTQHKGHFGDVTVIGGAPGMTGAALLAARAAHASGAGRIYLCLIEGSSHEKPSPAILSLDPVNPALMFRRMDELMQHTELEQTWVLGCGAGSGVAEVLEQAFKYAARLVIDADGLNAIAASPALRAGLQARSHNGRPTILTPHPLEAARLLACTTAQIQKNRLQAAQGLADDLGCVVALKGSGTILASPKATPFINLPGNASLGSPGTGDVLAGWMGGWWAQEPGIHPLIIARNAVAWHGLAAEPGWNGPALATDLIEQMSQASRHPDRWGCEKQFNGQDSWPAWPPVAS